MSLSEDERQRLRDVVLAHPARGTSVERFAVLLSEAKISVAHVDRDRLAELYLALACADGDQTAVAQFVRQYTDEIRRVVARQLAGTATEDMVQQVLTHLLVPRPQRPRIAGFGGSGTLRGFVRMVASRLVIDARRGVMLAHLESPDTIEEALVDQTNALDLLAKFEGRDRMTEALRGAISALDPVERRALRMRYVLCFSVARTARALAVHEVTVSRIVARARSRILTSLRESPDLPSDAAALAALADALDVSVCRYLESHPPNAGAA